MFYNVKLNPLLFKQSDPVFIYLKGLISFKNVRRKFMVSSKKWRDLIIRFLYRRNQKWNFGIYDK